MGVKQNASPRRAQLYQVMYSVGLMLLMCQTTFAATDAGTAQTLILKEGAIKSKLFPQNDACQKHTTYAQLNHCQKCFKRYRLSESSDRLCKFFLTIGPTGKLVLKCTTSERKDELPKWYMDVIYVSTGKEVITRNNNLKDKVDNIRYSFVGKIRGHNENKSFSKWRSTQKNGKINRVSVWLDQDDTSNTQFKLIQKIADAQGITSIQANGSTTVVAPEDNKTPAAKAPPAAAPKTKAKKAPVSDFETRMAGHMQRRRTDPTSRQQHWSQNTQQHNLVEIAATYTGNRNNRIRKYGNGGVNDTYWVSKTDPNGTKYVDHESSKEYKGARRRLL